MEKSLKRDIQLLTKISMRQSDINNVIKRFGCRRAQDLLEDNLIIDSCAFYLAQIGEISKNLTDDSKASLTFMDTGRLRQLRNLVAHTYDTVNKVVLATYVMEAQSGRAMKEVSDRIVYCKAQNLEQHIENKRIERMR